MIVQGRMNPSKQETISYWWYVRRAPKTKLCLVGLIRLERFIKTTV